MLRRVVFWALFCICAANASLFDFMSEAAIKSSYSSGDYNKTLKLLQTLDDTATVHYDLGNILYKLGRYSEAVREYKRAFGDGVDEHNRVHNLGNCYLRLGEYDSAIAAFTVALKLKDDADTRYNLAVAKREKSKPKKPKRKKKKSHQKHKSGNTDKKKSSSNKKNKPQKLTKKELKQLEAMQKRAQLKKELQKMMKKSFKERKIPVILYKLDTKSKRATNPR